MKVYCLKCDDIHEITDGQAEELIWGLQAEAAGNLTDPAIDRSIYKNQSSLDVMFCLKEALDQNDDIYLYAEHFQVLRAKRDEVERIRHCERMGISTCPEDCMCCSGEHCDTHTPLNEPCDCDVLERHGVD